MKSFEFDDNANKRPDMPTTKFRHKKNAREKKVE